MQLFKRLYQIDNGRCLFNQKKRRIKTDKFSSAQNVIPFFFETKYFDNRNGFRFQVSGMTLDFHHNAKYKNEKKRNFELCTLNELTLFF